MQVRIEPIWRVGISVLLTDGIRNWKTRDACWVSRVMFRAMLAVLLCGVALAQSGNYDVILRHGTIVDGTGGTPFRGDVAVRNGFIYRIGELSAEKAAVDLDVTGLVVAPGFVNLHSHASPAGVRAAVNMLTQGVTTEIVNADGSGSTAISKQLADFSANGLAVNLGAYIGFNSVWASVIGRTDRRPSVDEIQKMRDLLSANLKQGAWGVSAGLDYKPAYFARTEEVVAVMQAASPWRTNFPNHDRLTPESKYSSLVAIAETIEIGEKSNTMPVITHMKVQGKEQGNAPKALAMMRAASARGHETVADVYPYLAGQTGLGALLVPAWAVEGGQEEMLKRFHDPQLRPRIAREIEEAIEARFLTPENIDIPSKQHKLTDYMREMNAGAGETIIRILEKESPSAILKFGSETDLVELLRFPGSAIACDCGASEEVPGMHPRFFGTFPRVLGYYVRETHALTLEDAVRKMTGLPASIIGMSDRGFLAVGMAADITVFDPATIIDHSTYEQPTLPSVGIRDVLVNGRIALRDGKVTGEKGGHVLSRAENMPSRRMRMQGERSLSVKAKNLTIDLTQTAGGAPDKFRGTFRLFDTNTNTEIRIAEPGLLQADAKWASFTARARVMPDATDRTVRVIVDGGNPMNPHTAIHVDVDDGRRFESELKAGEYSIRVK
jgi:N-acyl-D-aspartate/D-glutamate deacylase